MPGPRRWWCCDRVANRAGVCNLVVPGRIVLDKPIGQFDAMLHLFQGQAKMAAYEQISIDRSIFPTLYVQSHPNAPTRPRIIRDADGRQGVIGLIENGIVQPITLNPGAQVPTAIDRLERAARLAANISPELGGESPTNVRTARRGASVLGSLDGHAPPGEPRRSWPRPRTPRTSGRWPP